jgi:hypothetical protein
LINEQKSDGRIQSVITNASNEEQETQYFVMKIKEKKGKEMVSMWCGLSWQTMKSTQVSRINERKIQKALQLIQEQNSHPIQSQKSSLLRSSQFRTMANGH